MAALQGKDKVCTMTMPFDDAGLRNTPTLLQTRRIGLTEAVTPIGHVLHCSMMWCYFLTYSAAFLERSKVLVSVLCFEKVWFKTV